MAHVYIFIILTFEISLIFKIQGTLYLLRIKLHLSLLQNSWYEVYCLSLHKVEDFAINV